MRTSTRKKGCRGTLWLASHLWQLEISLLVATSDHCYKKQAIGSSIKEICKLSQKSRRLQEPECHHLPGRSPRTQWVNSPVSFSVRSHQAQEAVVIRIIL